MVGEASLLHLLVAKHGCFANDLSVDHRRQIPVDKIALAAIFGKPNLVRQTSRRTSSVFPLTGFGPSLKRKRRRASLTLQAPTNLGGTVWPDHSQRSLPRGNWKSCMSSGGMAKGPHRRRAIFSRRRDWTGRTRPSPTWFASCT